jgi:hypothetical protein
VALVLGYPDGVFDRMILRPSTTWTFSALVTGRQRSGVAGTAGDSKGWRIEGMIKRDAANNTAIIGAVVSTVIANDAAAAAWTATATADDANEALQFDVAGEADKTIQWEAHVWVAEVGLGI